MNKLRKLIVGNRWTTLVSSAVLAGAVIAPCLAQAQDCVSDIAPCEDFVPNGNGCSSTCPGFTTEFEGCCSYEEKRCVGTQTVFRLRTCHWADNKRYCANYGAGDHCTYWP